MKFTHVLVLLFMSTGALASMDCEKKLVQHFETLNIDVKKPMKSQDYLNGDLRAISKKMYEHFDGSKAEAKALMEKSLIEARAFEAIDSRYNEIIRVCSAVRAFAEVGINPDEIEMKTLPFQNGWSDGMRKPLKEAIKKEVKQLKASNEINDICRPSAQKTKISSGTVGTSQ